MNSWISSVINLYIVALEMIKVYSFVESRNGVLQVILEDALKAEFPKFDLV
jgi:hypothetical protein